MLPASAYARRTFHEVDPDWYRWETDRGKNCLVSIRFRFCFSTESSTKTLKTTEPFPFRFTVLRSGAG